jgi:hypothetical protein
VLHHTFNLVALKHFLIISSPPRERQRERERERERDSVLWRFPTRGERERESGVDDDELELELCSNWEVWGGVNKEGAA